ncbi:MAG: FixH family protein [Gemmatimonadota bacterium]
MAIIRKERIWPLIVISVLSGYVTFGLVAARIASNDPNRGIEADYYRKAVTWDSSLARSRRSEALGWRLVPALSAITGSVATLRLELRARDGAPVDGAAVSLEGRQVAHADDVVRARLDARGGGAYDAPLPLARAGLWEFRIVATRGAERFATDVRLDASLTTSGSLIESRPGDPPVDRLKAGAQ